MKILGYLLIGYVILQAVKAKTAASTPLAPGDQVNIQSQSELAFWAAVDPGSVGTQTVNGVTTYTPLPDFAPGFSHDPSEGYT